MKDLWIIEQGKGEPKKVHEYFVFEDENEARESLELGDYLYRVPAESIVYLGECQMIVQR